MGTAVAELPSGAVLAIAFTSILIGAFVQGSLGFGMGAVAMPILVLAMPQHVPQALIVASIPLGLLLAAKEYRHVTAGDLKWILSGRFLGIPVGILVVTAASARTLQLVVGVVTLLVVGFMAMDRMHIALAPRTQLTGGAVSGAFGAAAGLGGPPLALLYADRGGPTLRATISVALVAGNVVIVPGYLVAGRLEVVDLVLGTMFLVPVLTGLGLGLLVRDHLQGPAMRRSVLVMVAFSATAAMVRAALG